MLINIPSKYINNLFLQYIPFEKKIDQNLILFYYIKGTNYTRLFLCREWIFDIFYTLIIENFMLNNYTINHNLNNASEESLPKN